MPPSSAVGRCMTPDLLLALRPFGCHEKSSRFVRVSSLSTPAPSLIYVGWIRTCLAAHSNFVVVVCRARLLFIAFRRDQDHCMHVSLRIALRNGRDACCSAVDCSTRAGEGKKFFCISYRKENTTRRKVWLHGIGRKGITPMTGTRVCEVSEWEPKKKRGLGKP